MTDDPDVLHETRLHTVTVDERLRIFASDKPFDDFRRELVGERLGMTTNAVFGAKRRVLEHIRELKLQFEAEE